jgi:hypothetical protein
MCSPSFVHPSPSPPPTICQDLPKSEAACWALLPGLKVLQQSASGYMLVAAAEAAAAGAAGAANVTSGIESLGLAGGHQVGGQVRLGSAGENPISAYHGLFCKGWVFITRGRGRCYGGYV